MEHDTEKAVNMKLILCIFEQLSGLKINFHKSEIFCFGKAKDIEHQYRQILGFESGALPFKYLGIPIHYQKLRNESGIRLKIVSHLSLGVGVARCFLMGIDWF